jgi:hypothetical protein
LFACKTGALTKNHQQRENNRAAKGTAHPHGMVMMPDVMCVPNEIT